MKKIYMSVTSEHHIHLLHPLGEVVQQTRMPSHELHSHANLHHTSYDKLLQLVILST
jgi:hypothetical protein